MLCDASRVFAKLAQELLDISAHSLALVHFIPPSSLGI
jgi:hypothetical protein